MTHIETGRGKQRHDRAEKTLKALTIYLEGGESLTDWSSTQLNSIGNDQSRSQGGNTSARPQLHFKSHFAGIKKNKSTPMISLREERAGSVSQGSEASASDGLPTKDLLGKKVAYELSKNFSRASNLLRQALDVDGVVFYNASTASFGADTIATASAWDGTVEPTTAERVKHLSQDTTLLSPFNTDANPSITTSHPSNSTSNATSPSGSVNDIIRPSGTTPSPSNITLKSSGATEKSRATSKPLNAKGSSNSFAQILGYSTRNRSSLRSQADSQYLGPFAGSFLRLLAKRYPNGKVFNIEHSADNVASPSTTTDTQEKKESTSTLEGKHQNKSSEEKLSPQEEGKAILKVTPGARSVIWFPLWDTETEKWFAGALIWSLSPTRVLNPEDELTHMVLKPSKFLIIG